MKTRMMRVNANGMYKEGYYAVYNRSKTNNDLVEDYVNPYTCYEMYDGGCQTNNHWFKKNMFVSYNTPIAYKIGKHIICNAERYSTTTSTIQNKIIREALQRGYQVHYVELACFMHMIYELEFNVNDDLYFLEYEEFLNSLENPLNLSLDDCKHIMSIDLETPAVNIK